MLEWEGGIQVYWDVGACMYRDGVQVKGVLTSIWDQGAYAHVWGGCGPGTGTCVGHGHLCMSMEHMGKPRPGSVWHRHILKNYLGVVSELIFWGWHSGTCLCSAGCRGAGV